MKRNPGYNYSKWNPSMQEFRKRTQLSKPAISLALNRVLRVATALSLLIFIFSSCTIFTPALPQLLFPSENLLIDGSEVTLSWNGGGMGISFSIYFGENSSSLTLLKSGLTTTSYLKTGLQSGKTYYWKVTAQSLFGETSSKEGSFRTHGENTYRSLLVGVTQFSPYAGNLNYTDDDANDMEIVLQHLSYMYENETLIGTVTKTTVQNSIAQAAEEAGEGDVFLFFFAGHGGRITPPSGGSRESYVLFSDGNRIFVSDLRAMLDEVAGTKIVIIDACYSGDFTQLSSGKEYETAARNELNMFNSDFMKAFSSGGKNGSRTDPEYYVVTGAGIEHSSWEDRDLLNGICTFFIADGTGHVGVSNPLEPFDSTYNADSDSNGQITLHELQNYVVPTVASYMAEQGQVQDVQVYPLSSPYIIAEW